MIFRVKKIISDIQRLTSNNLASDEMALEGTALDGIIRIKVVLKKPFLVAKSVTDFFYRSTTVNSTGLHFTYVVIYFLWLQLWQLRHLHDRVWLGFRGLYFRLRQFMTKIILVKFPFRSLFAFCRLFSVLFVFFANVNAALDSKKETPCRAIDALTKLQTAEMSSFLGQTR